MRTQELNLVGAESAGSNDACGLAGNPIALTYTQIASLFHQYREELTRRLIGMVKSRETAADLVQEAISILSSNRGPCFTKLPRIWRSTIYEKKNTAFKDSIVWMRPWQCPVTRRLRSASCLGNSDSAFFCKQSNIFPPELVRLFCSAECMGTRIKRLRRA